MVPAPSGRIEIEEDRFRQYLCSEIGAHRLLLSPELQPFPSVQSLGHGGLRVGLKFVLEESSQNL